jgi:hypothetical protein
MPWSPADIADAIYTGLKQRAAEDDLEQAVYGFDALDELGMHPIVHQSLRDAGYGVWPEQRYPGDREGSRKKSQGKRCDVVITRDGRPLRDPHAKSTLFDSPNAVDMQDAYWLEIKLVAQFEKTGPFKRYSSELLSPVAHDVKKLWNDGDIYHSGLLLILLTINEEVAAHDLYAWHRKCLEKGYPVAVPAARGFRITDRIGNGYCIAAVFGVRGM